MRWFFLVLVVSSSFAQAQSDAPLSPPPMPPPEPVGAPPPPPPVKQRQRRERVRVANARVDDTPTEFRPHFRWGAAGRVGYHVPTPGLSAGLDGHLGVQFTPAFGLYALIGLTVGVGFDGAPTSALNLFDLHAAVIAEGFFADLVYVGAGPMVAVPNYANRITSTLPTGGTQTLTIRSGAWAAGVDVRAGLQFGNALRRRGFNVGVELITLFYPGSTLTVQRGGSITSTVGLAANFTPMISLGFELR